MRKKFTLSVALTILFPSLLAQTTAKPFEQSYFKLTTSNGLITAVYDSKKNAIEYVCPHIFANYDSALYVHPFAGNIKLNGSEQPVNVSYLENTHIISAMYKDFTINYFASFTNEDKILYIAVKGEKQKIGGLSFSSEGGEGKLLTGISLLTYSHEDLRVFLSGNVLTGSTLRSYNNNIYEKYFLFSFTDSLHKDTAIITKAISKISSAKSSLADNEAAFMKNVFAGCKIPAGITRQERNVVEQSISFLKMAQVSDKEIFPYSHGQILASLRPGLWHAAWVRDGSFAIQAMTKLGMFDEAKKGLEFMLKAPSGRYKHYTHTDGKDYGIGSDYQVSVCRYYGNGKEESTQYDDGPNIEIDNFGLFLRAFSDYAAASKDSAFYKKWNGLVTTKIADPTVSCIDTNSLIKEDSGPWEHYLQMPRQYTFTSGVCSEGLDKFADLQKLYNLPYEKYKSAAERLKSGILNHTLVDGRYIKGNINDKLKTDHEYYDAGVYEIFANGLMNDRNLLLSHIKEYDNYLRIKGERPGYIRLNSNDPYENQEWVFINLRIAYAHLLYGQKEEAAKLINHVTEMAETNYNTIPEMFSNKLQLDKMTEEFSPIDVWCNCIRTKGDEYIGAIPMVGYGSGAYILSLFSYYEN
jgi:hypothetical protein